ncbi:MAG: glycosyl hydrolase [Prolixibacteraceae bacterium]|nr:glycosyl hydrolase [Prolixibacteraceae bacterium]MBT6763045.1 glycosyl hydrolase [Prolixibacteraceae bacterium]MBT6997323.1 glycosyl hydrolase [Prolixibacteraceae bacterium]MBT7395809.1 glycosyl hydrolase [Prolixibacteraceae bacterium]
MLCMQRASWEQGVAAQALLESGEHELVYLMAKEAALRQIKDGRLSIMYSDNGVTDPAASGEMVFRMAQKTGDKDLMAAHKKMLDYLLYKAPRSEDGIISHTISEPEFWIDSMYMSPPYLCVAGEYDESIKQIVGMRKALWNEKAKLYSHRWHVSQKKFISKNFWGVGNGWAVAGLARVIDDLPKSEIANKNKLVKYATENIDGCLSHLRSDGLFHNVVDDKNTFVETNLSQMLAYSIFRGVKSGWLSETYLSLARKMREAAYSKVDEFGFVNDVCGAPFFDSPGRATEGQAFFLLMETAFKNLISK